MIVTSGAPEIINFLLQRTLGMITILARVITTAIK
jgi:hypothetical protein